MKAGLVSGIFGALWLVNTLCNWKGIAVVWWMRRNELKEEKGVEVGLGKRRSRIRAFSEIGVLWREGWVAWPVNAGLKGCSEGGAEDKGRMLGWRIARGSALKRTDERRVMGCNRGRRRRKRDMEICGCERLCMQILLKTWRLRWWLVATRERRRRGGRRREEEEGGGGGAALLKSFDSFELFFLALIMSHKIFILLLKMCIMFENVTVTEWPLPWCSSVKFVYALHLSDTWHVWQCDIYTRDTCLL
jgi:hypothetical protein